MKAWGRAVPVGLSVATGVACLILLALGTWQVQRLHWKEQLLADLSRTRALPPVSAESLLGHKGVDWRQVHLSCATDPKRWVYMHGVSDGLAGFHVLTFCETDKGAVIADLGFTADRQPLTDTQTLSLNGRLRPFETPNAFVPPNNPKADDWYTRSVPELSKRWNVSLRSDYFVAATAPATPGLTPVDAAANLPNRHLEYALTWYGLAVALIGVYIAVLYSRRVKGIE